MSPLSSDLAVRPGKHPSSCHDPACTLSYRAHLLGIKIAANATPTRKPEVVQTGVREKRWVRDIDAYKRLHQQGYRPPQIDGSRLRERTATDVGDIERRPVTIDYTDPT